MIDLSQPAEAILPQLARLTKTCPCIGARYDDPCPTLPAGTCGECLADHVEFRGHGSRCETWQEAATRALAAAWNAQYEAKDGPA